MSMIPISSAMTAVRWRSSSAAKKADADFKIASVGATRDLLFQPANLGVLLGRGPRPLASVAADCTTHLRSDSTPKPSWRATFTTAP
jgi:hypothetical protein